MEQFGWEDWELDEVVWCWHYRIPAIQVPNGSTLVNNGFESYFKAPL